MSNILEVKYCCLDDR